MLLYAVGAAWIATFWMFAVDYARCYRGHGEACVDGLPVLDSLAWKLIRGTATMVKRISADHIKLKRAYEKASPEDGTRILIDRLWPRGISKEAAAIDHWFKATAPSTELRKWFGHDPPRWDEFRRRYMAELRQHAEQLGEIRKLARRGPITLVYAAHDELHNDAVVLRNVLLR